MSRLTRGYYNVLDFGQRNWYRFRQTEVGKAMIWLTPRALKATWYLTKVMFVMMGLMMVVTFGMMFGLLFIVTGNTKVVMDSITKVSIALIGFVAADRLLERRLAHAERLKAVK